MSSHLKRSHNTNLLLYHLVCPAKRRKEIFVPAVEGALTQVCQEIGACYEMMFIEIGTDHDHVHFLIQTIPTYAPTQIVKIIKSITAKHLLSQFPWIKKKTFGSSVWTSGYYISTVGAHGNEEVIGTYVRNQGKGTAYTPLHRQPLGLFPGLE